ncbi:Condensin complex subunit [Dirofilaria immitis]
MEDFGRSVDVTERTGTCHLILLLCADLLSIYCFAICAIFSRYSVFRCYLLHFCCDFAIALISLIILLFC